MKFKPKQLIGAGIALFVLFLIWDGFVSPMAQDRNDRADKFSQAASQVERRNTQAKTVRSKVDEVEAELAEAQTALPPQPLQQDVFAEISERLGSVGVRWESVSNDEPRDGPFSSSRNQPARRRTANTGSNGPAAAGSSGPTAEEREAEAAAAEAAGRASALTTYPITLRITADSVDQLAAGLAELREMERTVVVDQIRVQYPQPDSDTPVQANVLARYFAFEPGQPDPIPTVS